VKRLSLIILSAVLCGCTSMLPSGKTTPTKTVWTSYEQADQTISALIPFHDTRTDVAKFGIDPNVSSDITVMSYADVLQRFGVAMLADSNDADIGLSRCLRAGKRCNGYYINVKRIDSKRTGNFFSDSLQFTQTTETKGFSVSAIILFIDDTVVFTLVGGQPNINDTSTVHNPLGPLQGWGAAVTSRVH